MEEIVGTWIDEKPVYRQMFVLTLTGPSDNYNYTFTNQNINNLNLKTLVDIRGQVITINKKSYDIDTYYRDGNFSIRAYLRPEDSVEGNERVLTIGHNNVTVDGATAYVTLWYTKTTD